MSRSTSVPGPRQPAWAVVAVTIVLAACGGAGGDPGPTDPPAAVVAAVRIDPASLSLVAGQGQSITATPVDASGVPINGRTVQWASANSSVATVSGGLVSGVAAGSTTVTATCEGKTATVIVTVSEGSIVGAAGGTVVLGGGAITITIPPGALAQPTPISATLRPAVPDGMPDGWQVTGQAWSLSPDGTVFAKPARVTVRLDASTLPAWVMTGDLGLLRRHNGTWTALDSVRVDTIAGTVSAVTPGFSDFGAGVNDPEVTVTPEAVSVNDAHRLRELRVLVKPRGNGIPTPAGAPPIRYRWRTTGANGVLTGVTTDSWTNTEVATYIATDPALRQKNGHIDDVTVDILLNPESLTRPEVAPRIITRVIPVDADLAVTYDISPVLPRVDPGSSTTFRLVPHDKAGNAVALTSAQSVTWSATTEFGTMTTGSQPHPEATFTATTTFNTPPPRVDRVVATVTELSRHEVRRYGTDSVVGLGRTAWDEVVTNPVRGVDTTYVEVHVDYQVSVTPGTRTVKPFGEVDLDVAMTPAYTGPGLQYRYRKTGDNGVLDAPLNTTTDLDRVTFEAKADGDGTDVITVEVVAVVGGTVVAVFGSAEARITVDPAQLRPTWRLTSVQLVSGPQEGPGQGLANGPFFGPERPVLEPQNYLLHVFMTHSPELVPWSTVYAAPLVFLQESLPGEPAVLHPLFGGPPRRGWQLAGDPDPTGVNAVFATHTGGVTWTGTLISGSVSGTSESLVTQSDILRTFSIQATMQGKVMQGTIRRRFRDAWSTPANPIDYIWVYHFTAELVVD